MELLLALTSIVTITGLMALGRRGLPELRSPWLCPICVGVASTWLWIGAGLVAGRLPAAAWLPIWMILAAGSVVGLSLFLTARLPAGRSSLTFQTIVIPLGFALVASLAQQAWLVAGLAALGLLGAGAAFWYRPAAVAPRPTSPTNLESELDQCCR